MESGQLSRRKINSMKKYILYSLLFVAVLSCRKDKTIPFCELHPDQCREVAELKDYFLFGVGSYWVYEEENSGMIDSMYVTESSFGPYCYNSNIIIHSDFDGYNYHFWSRLATSGCPTCGLIPMNKHCVFIYKSKTKPGDFVSESCCFFTYAGVGDWIYSSSGGAPYYYDNLLVVYSVYDSLLVHGKYYPDVVCIHEEHTASEDKQPTYHYYSKGIGLIKKELVDSNQIWNLVNYHIEQ